MSQSLEDLRKEIDLLDNQLLDLLNSRMKIIKQVGELKKTQNAIIYRPEREKNILDRLELRSQIQQGLLNRSAIDAIFMEIFAASRNYELPELIAYLGPEGSFTHQAAESRFGSMSDYIPLKSIRAVFDSVVAKRVRFGVVPVENNLEGFVNETIDLLYEMPVKIVAEIPLPIHHTFASRSEKLNEIKIIYSKDIAFKQCKVFLNDYFKDSNVEFIPVESTSKAAKLAMEQEHTAAICSNVAAKIFGVPILYENIEDSQNNETRFLIISADFVNQKSERDKTTIIVHLMDEPGSLAHFLNSFSQYHINITKIQSRPLGNFKSWFYIEFDGHFEDENIKKILDIKNGNVKYLGSYVKLC